MSRGKGQLAKLAMPMRTLCLPIALLGAACASPGASADMPAPQGAAQEVASDVALTPSRILDAMAEAYTGCTSYRDSGVSTTKIANGPIVQKPFKTAFVRPKHFRFECSQWAPLSKLVWVVWTDGTVVKLYSTVERGSRRVDSLPLALAAATGVSGGAAWIVPKLLLPADGSGPPLTDMTDVERIADADVGTARCFCLRGRLADFTMTLWIDQQTHLLRRVERLTQSEGLEATEVTTYEPEIDKQIADAELDFVPP